MLIRVHGLRELRINSEFRHRGEASGLRTWRELPAGSCKQFSQPYHVFGHTLFLRHDGAWAAGTTPVVTLFLRHDGAWATGATPVGTSVHTSFSDASGGYNTLSALTPGARHVPTYPYTKRRVRNRWVLHPGCHAQTVTAEINKSVKLSEP